VRFALGPHAVQATTRQLLPQGVFIRSVAPPRAGLQVAVRVYFAEGKPEDFVGRVDPALAAIPDGETGFWVRFDLVTPQAREKILVASGALARPQRPLHHTPSGGVPAVQAPGLRHTPSNGVAAVQTPGLRHTPSNGVPAVQPFAPDAVVPSPRPAPGAQRSGTDLRATPRYAARLRTVFKTVAALREEFTHNISAGGLFIQTDTAPPLRQTVLVSLDLPGESEPLEVLAEVMHVVRPEQATAQLPAGVGVQFVQADDRFREKLDRYLATHR
jgi:uncharacterized protein (TIGR02266 family)